MNEIKKGDFTFLNSGNTDENLTYWQKFLPAKVSFIS